MNIKNIAILVIAFISTALLGCSSDDGSDTTPPSLTGAYYTNDGAVLLALEKHTKMLFDNKLINVSGTNQSGNTLKLTQLTDATGINDFSNKEITASYDGSGMQVTGFNTTTYLHRLPVNPPLAGSFAGSYNSGTANWVINSDNTFTATSTTTGCLLTGELTFAPFAYVVANTVATSCTDNQLNGNYREGYAVYGDLPNGENWLGIVIWRNGAAIWDHVPLN